MIKVTLLILFAACPFAFWIAGRKHMDRLPFMVGLFTFSYAACFILLSLSGHVVRPTLPSLAWVFIAFLVLGAIRKFRTTRGWNDSKNAPSSEDE